MGSCLLCNNEIKTENDFIHGRNTHNCEAGREFEAQHNTSGALPIEIKAHVNGGGFVYSCDRPPQLRSRTTDNNAQDLKNQVALDQQKAAQ